MDLLCHYFITQFSCSKTARECIVLLVPYLGSQPDSMLMCHQTFGVFMLDPAEVTTGYHWDERG